MFYAQIAIGNFIILKEYIRGHSDKSSTTVLQAVGFGALPNVSTKYGWIAQSAERLFYKQDVVGAIPTPPTKNGAPDQGRTDTLKILSLLPLPVGLLAHGRNGWT